MSRNLLTRCRLIALVGSMLAALSTSPGLAATALSSPGPAPRITRAGLDPALVEGRGATVAFVEQEAENAFTTGEKIGPSREAYTLPAEASGRTAVRLVPGQYVEFTLTRPANALTLRYSIPDTPAGGGMRAPLDVAVNGKRTKSMTLTSEYAWLYGMYPFSNDPNVDPIPGWWKPEPDPVAKPFRPNHFYDEQRLMLGKTYQAGDRVRFAVPRNTPAAWYVLDLADFEFVGAPVKQPPKSLSVRLFGADPTGRYDAAPAIERTISVAKKLGWSVFIPPGTYQVNRHIIVDRSPSAAPATGGRSSRDPSSRSPNRRRTSPSTAHPGSTASTRPTAAAPTASRCGPSRTPRASSTTTTSTTTTLSRRRHGQPRRGPDPGGLDAARRFTVQRDAVRGDVDLRPEHDGPRWSAGSQLEPRAGRDLAVRVAGRHVRPNRDHRQRVP